MSENSPLPPPVRVCADWGSSRLRAWVMADGRVEARSSEAGAAGLGPEDFEAALLALVGDLLPPRGPVPVLVAGMAGARQGWQEAPYLAVPCTPPDAVRAVRVRTADPRLRVRILPGLSQARPADVLRSEEMQIAGLLAADPRFDGVACLPGTHCKWAHVSAGEVVSFRTFMTGELFALLSRQSVLRHGVAGEGWDQGAFLDAVGDAMSRPAEIAARLFTLRAEGLLAGLGADVARARLSGLLIGAELAAARPYWLGQRVAVIGAGEVAAAYVAALEAQGVQPERHDGGALALAGLTAAMDTWGDGA